MSVMTTPSIDQTESLGSEPFATNCDCWPLSEPATLTRSTVTPGIERIRAQGSREVGMPSSSSRPITVAVPTLVGSTTGVSALTSTVSWTAATFRLKSMLTLSPVRTTTCRLAVAKPARLTVRVCDPWSTLSMR